MPALQPIVPPEPVAAAQTFVAPEPVVAPQPLASQQPVVLPLPPVQLEARSVEPTRVGPVNLPTKSRRGLHLPGLRLVVSTLVGVVLFGLAVLLTPLSQVAGGLQILAVMSGSMEPTINVGGIVGVRPFPANELQVGDIITFTNPSTPDVPITHRVMTVENRGGQTLLTTKGDANDSVDAFTTATSRSVGKVEFTLPWLGYLMFWLSTPLAKVGILAVSLLGFVLPSIKFKKTVSTAPDPSAAVRSSESYRQLEREIQDLLTRAS
jgi:signal peptidase